jgi:hypothetical protein
MKYDLEKYASSLASFRIPKHKGTQATSEAIILGTPETFILGGESVSVTSEEGELQEEEPQPGPSGLQKHQ